MEIEGDSMFREVNLRSVHAPGGPDHLRIRLRSRLYNSQDMISLVLDGLGGKYIQPRHFLYRYSLSRYAEIFSKHHLGSLLRQRLCPKADRRGLAALQWPRSPRSSWRSSCAAPLCRLPSGRSGRPSCCKSFGAGWIDVLRPRAWMQAPEGPLDRSSGPDISLVSLVFRVFSHVSS